MGESVCAATAGVPSAGDNPLTSKARFFLLKKNFKLQQRELDALADKGETHITSNAPRMFLVRTLDSNLQRTNSQGERTRLNERTEKRDAHSPQNTPHMTCGIFLIRNTFQQG